MDSSPSNREVVMRCNDLLVDALRPELERFMRRHYRLDEKDNWIAAAHENKLKGRGPAPRSADLQFLLRCLHAFWWPYFANRGQAARSHLGLLQDTRNGLLAHYADGTTDITADAAIEAVTPAVRMLEAFEAKEAATATSMLVELRTRAARQLLSQTPHVGVAVGQPTSTPRVAQVAVPAAMPVERQATTTKASMSPYPGNVPSNVSKDAKYTCGLDGKVRLLYHLGNREETLLTTDAHPALVEMVRAVKEHHGETAAGIFYINEYSHVLVKVAGGTWFAGSYPHYLEFEFESRVIGPLPEKEAKPGDQWRGPRVGTAYTLTADGRDIYYKRETRPGVVRKELLSDYVKVHDLTRVARLVKQHGGRLYINEARALFTPVQRGSQIEFVFLGVVTPEEWFPVPEVGK